MMQSALLEGRSLKLHRKQENSHRFFQILFGSVFIIYWSAPTLTSKMQKKRQITKVKFLMYVLISKISFQIMLKKCWT